MTERILDCLRRKAFETPESKIKSACYAAEKYFGRKWLTKKPAVKFSGKYLNLGCGSLYYEGFCNADEFSLKRSLSQSDFRPDWKLDLGSPWACPDNFWGGIFSQHVLEHLTYSEAIVALEESFRTLEPGCWMRIVVPSLEKYINYYNSKEPAPIDMVDGLPKALSISFLSQMHFHRTVWDGQLMFSVLEACGFTDIRKVEYGSGFDRKLANCDQEAKKRESLYVECRKPEDYGSAL